MWTENLKYGESIEKWKEFKHFFSVKLNLPRMELFLPKNIGYP